MRPAIDRDTIEAQITRVCELYRRSRNAPDILDDYYKERAKLLAMYVGP